MNAVFSGGAASIEAELLVPVTSVVMPAAPVVAAVPDTAGDLLVSWQAPDGTPPASYQVDYRMRGASEWASAGAGGGTTHLPILFLDQDTEYEARVRATTRRHRTADTAPRRARRPSGRIRGSDAPACTSRAASRW